MKYISKELPINNISQYHYNKLNPFIKGNLQNLLIFDIETTGLNHKYNKVILIGYLFIKNNKIIIEQLFCENLSEEYDILMKFKKISQNFDYHISYNGNTFDIPFLNARYLQNNIQYSLHKAFNLDLLRVAKNLSKKLNLENYKLKTVEEFLGIYREDVISGKESVDLYKKYLATHNLELEKTILLHNYEDILYLEKVVNLLHYQEDNDLKEIPICIKYKQNRYYLIDYKISNDFVKINVLSRDFKKRSNLFCNGEISLEQTENLIKLKAPIFKLNIGGVLTHFLDIDLISNKKVQFNNLSFTDKMKLHIEKSNIMNIVQILFEYII